MAEEQPNETPESKPEPEAETRTPTEDILYKENENAEVNEEGSKEEAPAEESKPEETDDGGETDKTVLTEEKTEIKKEDAKEKDPEGFDLKLPEASLLSPDRVEEVKAYAKKQGLTAEVAQDILDGENEILSNYAQQLQPGGEAWTKMETQLRQQTIEDTEIGGNDDNVAKTKNLSVKALKAFLKEDEIKEMSKLLSTSGGGSHPLILKFLRRIGESMADDHIEKGTTAIPKKPKTDTEVFYGAN